MLRKIGGLHWEAGDREGAGACFARGLEQLGDDGDPIERAHLFQEMGRLAFRAGDNAAAIAWAERALAEATHEEETATEPERAREAAVMRTQAYNTLGVALARTGRLTEAVQQIERSIGLAEERELLQAACRGYTNLGVLYSSLDPRRSIETCLRGLETAKKVGDLGFQSRLYANLAVASDGFMKEVENTRVNPFGEFPAPVPLMQSAEASAKLDGFVGTETDQADMMRQFPQLKGQFLIDRDGIVRWANIECATEGLAGIGKFPAEEEILAAARAMLRR